MLTDNRHRFILLGMCYLPLKQNPQRRKKMDKNKTTVEELVEEWLSYDKKRNLRETTYSWLGITKKVKTSTPKNKEDKVGSRAEVSRLKINNNQGKVPEMESTFANTTNHKGLVKAAILDL